LLFAPAAAAFSLQGPPPATPPRAPTPRVEPRLPDLPETPRTPRAPIAKRYLDGWRDLDHDLADLKYNLRDLEYLDHDLKFRLEMPEIPPMPEMPVWTNKMDMNFDARMDMKADMRMDRLDSKLRDLDVRMGDLNWPVERFKSTPRAELPFRRESFATSPRAAWLQGDVADSLYKSAYELLNRGEWRRAAASFATIPQRFPNSGYAADALYWQAFSLYRIGNTDDLNAALRSLETMRTKYPQAKTQSDAAALTTRIRGTLASRGDRSAEAALKQTMSEQGQQCDREDQAVRSEALKALAQTDPGSVAASVKRVLAKKDACSAPLRRTAVYLLGNSGDNTAPALLRDVALNDSEPEVRSAAIQYLARSPSDVAVNTLDEILRTTTDQNVLRTAARALAANPSPRARQSVRALIERADAPERLRIEAIGGFEDSQRTTDEDAAYLRALYPKMDNPRIKARIARVIGQLGGEQNDQWLFGLMRNNDEPLEVRSAALQRVASRNNTSIGDAVKLYGTVADRQLREQLINVYGQRREPEATDKLLDIVKNDTDYRLRSQAINALTRKNDPRATKLLMEIIDK
jgi:HEAT repeat protein